MAEENEFTEKTRYLKRSITLLITLGLILCMSISLAQNEGEIDIKRQIAQKQDRIKEIDLEVEELEFSWWSFLKWNFSIGYIHTPLINFPVWYFMYQKPKKNKKTELVNEKQQLEREIQKITIND